MTKAPPRNEEALRQELLELRRALEAEHRRLKESEQRLRLLEDNLPSSMLYQAVVNPDGTGRITFLSAGVAQAHGITPEQVYSDPMTLLRQIHEEDLPRLIDAEKSAIRTESPFNVELRFRPPDGDLRWALLRATPHRTIDGCGMSPDVLDHLFEPFFTTKEVGRGTGLGLATVYGIVKQNEGFIGVTSKQGKGTTFTLYLPPAAAKSEETTAVSAAKMWRSSGETVLLVEDEQAVLGLCRTILKRMGFAVLTADTPGEAIRQAEEHRGSIDLLITDVVMPEMNGRDLAAQISLMNPGLRCLFMSGYTADVIAHRGVLEEGIDFIQKPFSLEEMSA